jgi:hypothetical protein
MLRVLCSLLLASAAAFGQYKSDTASAPPSEVGAAALATLNKTGTKIMLDNGTAILEIWFRSGLPSGPASTEEHVTLPMIPKGSFLGVMRVLTPTSDSRGQMIPAGVYTLRYGIVPGDAKHEGAAPQRDFMLLSKASDDQNTDAAIDSAALMKQSAKVAGTPHPVAFSLWKAQSDFPGFTYENEADWVLQSKIGSVPFCTTVVWKP